MYKNQIVLKSGYAFEFDDANGNVRQNFLKFLQGASGSQAHVCNLQGEAGTDITLDLREVASVVTIRK